MTFTIHYDAKVLRTAVDTFFWRRFAVGMGWSGLLAFVLCGGVLAWLLVRGDRSWISFLIGGVLVVFVLGFLLLWFLHRRQMGAKLRAIPSRRGEVMLAADAITITTDAGSSTLSWSGFTELWKLPDCWLLFMAPNNFVTVPLQGVSQDALDFIDAHMPAGAVRIGLRS